MKCPGCENDVPSDRSACPVCGAALPSTGERSGPEPRFATAPPKEAPNPQTEPFQMPDWNADAEEPWGAKAQQSWGAEAQQSWGAPRDPFVPPEPNAMRPDPGAVPNHGAPPPQEQDGATQYLSNPGPVPPGQGPMPPGQGEGGWNPPPGPGPAGPAFGPGPTPPPGYQPVDWNQGAPPPGAPGMPPGATGKSRRTPLLIGAIAAVVVIGAGLAFALTRGGSDGKTPAASATPSAGSAARQAAAVSQILKSGQTARNHLPGRLRTCDDVSAGVPGFQQVVRDRQQELSQSKKLSIDGLHNGARLRRWMVAAYQYSLSADQAYLAWAKEIQARGCGHKVAPLTAHYKDAIAANDKAGPAKRQVIALWKPTATSQKLPTYAWNRL